MSGKASSSSSKAGSSTAQGDDKVAAEARKKGVANFARKTWDEKEYATKALAREERYSRQTLPLPGSERSFAQARESSLGLDAKIGKRYVLLFNCSGDRQASVTFF
jgi:hypothetical protein